jgi:hypothetical protein
LNSNPVPRETSSGEGVSNTISDFRSM